jgi:hypothetical protein
MFEICRSRLGAMNDLFEIGAVLGMHPLSHRIYGWLDRAFVFENTVGFIGPNGLASVRFPSKAAGLAEFLCFRQVRLAC